MKISVIIPSYKPQNYIWECLDSLKNQTFSKSDFEIILVLNGCNEPYKTQIDNYIEKNLQGYNLNFIQTDQGGVSNARNIALDVAQGEYITFIDDDDFVSEVYLEELYLKATPEVISLCYPYAFDDGKIEVQRNYAITDVFDKNVCGGKQEYQRGRKYFSGPVMKLISKNYISDRRFDVRFRNGEDSIFMFLISDKFKFVDFTSKEAVYYRRYRENSAVTMKRSKMKIINNQLKMIVEYLKIYFRNPLKYDFKFFVTRILGAVNMILFSFKNK